MQLRLKILRKRLLWIITILTYISVECANWEKFSGSRETNVASTYEKPSMWSPRWGHAVVVSNEMNDKSTVEKNDRITKSDGVIMLLGGDDYSRRRNSNQLVNDENQFYSGGLKNDIWLTSSLSTSKSNWNLDKRLSKSIPKYDESFIRTNMTWWLSNTGREPPVTWPSGPRKGEVLTFDEWISCQDYFDSSNELFCTNDEMMVDFKSKNMWSPRRGHAAVTANNAIFVIGGRAREYSHFGDNRIVGGVTDRPMESMKDHLTLREESLLKNDIWVSDDGMGLNWRLVTPGCKDHQQDILASTEVWQRQNNNGSTHNIVGSEGSKCNTDSDCYGDSKCTTLNYSDVKVCVCSLFSMREHHAVAVQRREYTRADQKVISEDYIFLVGGFTNVRQGFCSNNACGSSGSYRLALNDAWVSNNGRSWIQIRSADISSIGFRARGAHTMLFVPSNVVRDTGNRLIIIGGETSDPKENDVEYLNDAWSVDVDSKPCCFFVDECMANTQVKLNTSHVGSCLPDSSDWSPMTMNVTLIGRSGHTAIYVPPSPTNNHQDIIHLIGGKNSDVVFSDVWTWNLNQDTWILDFTSEQYFNIFSHNTSVDRIYSKSPSPYNDYYDEDSDLGLLKESLLPISTTFGDRILYPHKTKFFLNQDDVEILHNNDISTLGDLVDADVYTILRLRGISYPGVIVPEVPNICYLKALAHSLIDKCKINQKRYSIFDSGPITLTCKDPKTIDKCVVNVWDGCKPITGYKKINVHGLGYVPVPQTKYNVSAALEEMHCRHKPGERNFAAGTYVAGRVVLLGGQGKNKDILYQDLWARDDSFTKAIIVTRPESYTSQSKFEFSSKENKALLFEYKIVDYTERLDVTPWIMTTVSSTVDISWLDSKRGGPGSGWYTLYVRAVNPSGNRDHTFLMNDNMFTWYYKQPLPWSLIIWLILLFLAIVFGSYFEYRRREHKAALERYAARRMRRKYKLRVMEEMVGTNDWKDYYHNDKIKGSADFNERMRQLEGGGDVLYYENSIGPPVVPLSQNRRVPIVNHLDKSFRRSGSIYNDKRSQSFKSYDLIKGSVDFNEKMRVLGGGGENVFNDNRDPQPVASTNYNRRPVVVNHLATYDAFRSNVSNDKRSQSLKSLKKKVSSSPALKEKKKTM